MMCTTVWLLVRFGKPNVAKRDKKLQSSLMLKQAGEVVPALRTEQVWEAATALPWGVEAVVASMSLLTFRHPLEMV